METRKIEKHLLELTHEYVALDSGSFAKTTANRKKKKSESISLATKQNQIESRLEGRKSKGGERGVLSDLRVIL